MYNPLAPWFGRSQHDKPKENKISKLSSLKDG